MQKHGYINTHKPFLEKSLHIKLVKTTTTKILSEHFSSASNKSKTVSREEVVLFLLPMIPASFPLNASQDILASTKEGGTWKSLFSYQL